MMTGQGRAESSKDEQVEYLLRKTIENGATAGEEVSAVQLAHMIVRQHGLDMDAFKAALAKIGHPPRYRITEDGFLVRAEAEQPGDAFDATPRREAEEAARQYAGAAQTAVDDCPVSPTRRHRMEKFMQGTLATGQLYCIHCGVKRDASGRTT